MEKLKFKDIYILKFCPENLIEKNGPILIWPLKISLNSLKNENISVGQV